MKHYKIYYMDIFAYEKYISIWNINALLIFHHFGYMYQIVNAHL